MQKIILLFLFNISLFANTLMVNRSDNIATKHYIQYAKVNELNETIRSISSHSWVKELKSLKLDSKNLAFWMRFKVTNTNEILEKFYLMPEQNFIYTLEYFLVHKNTVKEKVVFGYHTRQKNPPFITPHNILPLPLAKNEEHTVYLKVQTLNLTPVNFSIVTEKYIKKFYASYNVVQGVFLGAIIVILLTNLSLFIITKFTPYIWYILFTISSFSYTIVLLGYITAYTPIPVLYINILFLLSVLGVFIFIVKFLQKLFYFNKKSPKINKLINYIQIYLIIDVLLYAFFILTDNFIFSYFCSLFFPIFLPFYYLFVLYVLFVTFYKKKDKMALAYALTWSFLGMVALLQVALDLGLLHVSFQPIYILEFGMLFESLLLSFFLALRIKEVEKEKNKKQTLLIQQNKLVSMGEMVSAIAHQWRQPLGEINGVVLSMDIDHRKNLLNKDRINKHLDDIENITSYLSHTISDFLEYSNSNQIIEEFFLSDVIKKCEEITMLKIHYKDEYKIYGYKSELLQAFLIIANNSIDACKALHIKPKIILSIAIEEHNVCIAIRDNGGGIKSSIMPEIFNPYFTTKHASKGTGLGLYILKMIIEDNMQGEIEVSNVLGGSIIALRIPKKLEKIKNSQVLSKSF